MVSTLLFFPRTQHGFRVPGFRVLLQEEPSLHPFPFFNLHCPDPKATSIQQDLVHVMDQGRQNSGLWSRMSGSVSSSILETEEDREELPTLGPGALRKLLLETVADSPCCKWSRSWGSMATRRPTSGCWEGSGENKAGLSRRHCGD